MSNGAGKRMFLTLQQMKMQRSMKAREFEHDLYKLNGTRQNMAAQMVMDPDPFVHWDPQLARIRQAYEENWGWWDQLQATLADVCPASQFAGASCTALAACQQALAQLVQDMKELWPSLIDIVWATPALPLNPEDYPESNESPPPSPTPVLD